MSKTIAQDRSLFALEKVSVLPGDIKEFSKLAANLPAMILQNGFGHALAFLLAKGTKNGTIQPEDKHIKSFEIIVEWLKRRGIINSDQTNKKDAITELANMEQNKYLLAQEETLHLLEWVKRYSAADIF